MENLLENKEMKCNKLPTATEWIR